MPDTQISMPTPAFFLGAAWCYYKFYCGPKTGDLLLTEALGPLIAELQKQGQLEKWFFIRYADPRGHLRLRLHISQMEHVNEIIARIHAALSPLLDQRLVWKVQTDTYQRELERYGLSTMELSETVFYFDSRMVTGILSLLDGDGGERTRWLMALRASDRLLDDFGLSLTEKAVLIGEFRDGYGREFGMNKGLKQQMETKYRQDKKEIERVLGTDGLSDELLPFYQVIDERSVALRPLAQEINRLTARPESDVKQKELLNSYLHMMNNRMFRSRQRLHELVLYDFLALYYRSRLAREKKGPKDSI